jgi:hypothetical protein
MRRERLPRNGEGKASGLGRNTGVRDLSYKVVVVRIMSAPRMRGALWYFTAFMSAGLSGGRLPLPWS